uniref:Uncharacterized protein n=1 Tax=Parastrongyloides trichosuri TaxID=131310 RepID=A0A0N4ZH90_PARTI
MHSKPSSSLLKCMYFIFIFLIVCTSTFLIFNNILWNDIYPIYKSKIINKNKNIDLKPFFNKDNLTKYVDCPIYFNSNSNFNITQRISIIRNLKNLSVTCEDIRKRRFFPSIPLSKEEDEFPLSFSFTVYTEYFFIELLLSLIYQPQNFYCFAIDAKQDGEFRSKIHSLTNCFENVFVSKIEYDMNSKGLNNVKSHRECLKKLNNYNWKYVFLLQNHDFPLKTNAELVQILKLFDQTSDFLVLPPLLKRVNLLLDWTFGGLKIFKNEKKINSSIYTRKIEFSKGYSAVAISRQTYDYMTNELNLTAYQNNFDVYPVFGNDEMFWQSLFVNYEILKIPGTIPSHCIGKKDSQSFYTRFAQWEYGKDFYEKCLSHTLRHYVCLLGVEYLKTFESNEHFFLNKMLQSFDFAAIDCWSERLFNRTYFPYQYSKIDMKKYDNRIQKRFQDFLKVSQNISGFNCEIN